MFVGITGIRTCYRERKVLDISNDIIGCIEYNAEMKVILETERKVISTSWKTLTAEVHITQPGGK